MPPALWSAALAARTVPGRCPFRAETIHGIVSGTPFTLQRQARLDRVRRENDPPRAVEKVETTGKLGIAVETILPRINILCQFQPNFGDSGLFQQPPPGSFSDPPYSVKVADRPRLPDGAPNHCVSGSNQISNEPRCLSAALAIGLEPMAPQWLDKNASSSYDSSEVWVCSCTPTNILESRRESLEICATEPCDGDNRTTGIPWGCI